MKCKILAVLLLALLLSALAGCTAKEPEQSETYRTPELNTGAEKQSEQETGAAPNTPGHDETPPASGQNSADGSGTGETRPGSPVETAETLPDSEDEGLEIESGYTVAVDDGLGIGGN